MRTDEEGVCPLFEIIQRGALSGGLGTGPNHVATLERGELLRDALPDLLVVNIDDRIPGQARQVGNLEGERLGSLSPTTAELGLRYVIGLGPAGVERGGLGSLGTDGAVELHGLDDLAAAVAERPPQGLRDARDIGVAMADLLEQEPQRPGQLVAQDRLVHEAGRARLAVEVASVERCPTAVGPLGQVGQKNMGMKGGIAEATGAVPEGSGHEAVCSLDVDSTMSSTDVTGVALQVRDGGVNASLVAVDHGLGGARVTQSPYQGTSTWAPTA